MPDEAQMDDWNTCRVCHQAGPSQRMVKYGIRHYAHFACYLESGRSLDTLPAWQVRRFPALLLNRHGLMAEAERLSI